MNCSIKTTPEKIKLSRHIQGLSNLEKLVMIFLCRHSIENQVGKTDVSEFILSKLGIIYSEHKKKGIIATKQISDKKLPEIKDLISAFSDEIDWDKRAKSITVSLKLTKEFIEQFEPGYDQEVADMINKVLTNDQKEDLQRGDIIEVKELAGYRNDGKYIYDGKKAIPLDTDIDEYGCIPKEFKVLDKFPPRYWEKEITHNMFIWLNIDDDQIKEMLKNLKRDKTFEYEATIYGERVNGKTLKTEKRVQIYHTWIKNKYANDGKLYILLAADEEEGKEHTLSEVKKVLTKSMTGETRDLFWYDYEDYGITDEYPDKTIVYKFIEYDESDEDEQDEQDKSDEENEQDESDGE